MRDYVQFNNDRHTHTQKHRRKQQYNTRTDARGRWDLSRKSNQIIQNKLSLPTVRGAASVFPFSYLYHVNTKCVNSLQDLARHVAYMRCIRNRSSSSNNIRRNSTFTCFIPAPNGHCRRVHPSRHSKWTRSWLRTLETLTADERGFGRPPCY